MKKIKFTKKELHTFHLRANPEWWDLANQAELALDYAAVVEAARESHSAEHRKMVRDHEWVCDICEALAALDKDEP